MNISCKFLIVTLFLFLSCKSSHSQVPQGINYQAVIRNDDKTLLDSEQVNIRFTILDEFQSVVYQETNDLISNSMGLVTAIIGQGKIVTGELAGIDWFDGNYYLQVEIDLGNGFVNSDISQLMSVPYSLAAQKSMTATNMNLNDLQDVDALHPSEGQILEWDGQSWVGGSNNRGGSNSQWTTTGTDIYYNDGDVGIGVTSPSHKLHIKETGSGNKQTLYVYTGQNSGADYSNIAITGFAQGASGNHGSAIGIQGVVKSNVKKGGAGVLARLGSPYSSFSLDSIYALFADANGYGYAGAFINGNVGIGTTTPTADLHLLQTKLVGSGGGLRFQKNSAQSYWTIGYGSSGDLDFYWSETGNNNGNLKGYLEKDGGVWTSASDLKLKTEIEPLCKMLGVVDQLQPVKYYFRDTQNSATRKTYGFIAQEVQTILPEVVMHKDDILTLAYTDFGVISVQAIKELHEIVKTQETTISEQQQHIDIQQRQIEMLQKNFEELKTQFEILENK